MGTPTHATLFTKRSKQKEIEFLESQLLVQTLQNWTRNSCNLLESKGTNVYMETNCKIAYSSLHKQAFSTNNKMKI